MVIRYSDINLATKLTILRILFVPVFLVLLYFNTTVTNILATIVFTVAGITDWVDGYIARKYDQITDLGKILDPVADKIMVAAAMIALVDIDRLGAVIVIILLTRDFAVGALRDFISSKGTILAAGFSGKLKTAFQMVGIGFLSWHDPLFGLNIHGIGIILMYISLALSLYSGYVYYRGFFRLGDE